MVFNTNNGVFDAPAITSGTAKNNIPPRTVHSIRSRGRKLPASLPDVIGVLLLCIEIVLLIVFAQPLFYQVIFPAVTFLFQFSGVVLLLGIGVCLVKARIRGKYRRKWWF